MKTLYHGTIRKDIEALYPVSKLHNTDKKVVYLTGNIAYALFYIWDGKHNKKQGKYVTCSLKDGIVYYEELFPNMLEAFYKGVKGYVYEIENDNSFFEVLENEDMWYSEKTAYPNNVIYISDVYEEILKHEQKGQIKIIRFNDVKPERIQSLNEHIKNKIIANKLLDKPDSEDSIFYSIYFTDLWEEIKKETIKSPN
ncbi:MAG: hypothetical protein IJX51_05185 [Clostridia bacterium]|nr:hypothetical protein [Clostridia bacterium]